MNQMRTALARDRYLMQSPPNNLNRSAAVAILIFTTLSLTTLSSDKTYSAPADTKPYDAKLYRLSEILGAVHYLRELCGSNDGQLWRDHMRSLITAEGTSAIRRARLTRSFNNGYRSYSRTYSACTPSAKTAIERFIVEAVEISEGIVKNVP